MKLDILHSKNIEEIEQMENIAKSVVIELSSLLPNHINVSKFRIKTKESIDRKLKRNGHSFSNMENAKKYLCDIIGVRLVVDTLDNLYVLKDKILNKYEGYIIKTANYITNPKSTGYRGYHIVLLTLFEGSHHKVEVQLHTPTMDAWAEIDHKIRYKNESFKDSDLKWQLEYCAAVMAHLDK